MNIQLVHTEHTLFFLLHFTKHSTHKNAFQTKDVDLNNICFPVCTIARWATFFQNTTNSWPELQCGNMNMNSFLLTIFMYIPPYEI